jgi:hypothetical protein
MLTVLTVVLALALVAVLGWVLAVVERPDWRDRGMYLDPDVPPPVPVDAPLTQQPPVDYDG